MTLNTVEGILTALIPEWYLLLQSWSSSGRLSAAAQEALLLSGEPQELSLLISQWSSGNFSGLPPIVLLSDADISGAMGAYATSTTTIYLNADWLASASKDQIFAVLTEELGHHLDRLLNAVDTPGDEGAIFSSLLRGSIPSQVEKFQNDAIWLNPQGKGFIQAEAAIIPDTTPPTIISLNNPSQLADGQLNLSSGESPLLSIAGKITDTNDAGSSGSGFSYLGIQLTGPNSQSRSIYINEIDLAIDGSFAKTLDMSWALSGSWTIASAYISDKAGNQVNYQYSDPTSISNFKNKTGIDLSSLLNFTLTNPNADTTSPTVISLSNPSQLADGQLNLSSGESPLLTIAGKITDTNDAGSFGSGFSYLGIQLTGPNSQSRSIYINEIDLAIDGSFVKTLDMSWALSGSWTISFAYIIDKAGNQAYYQSNNPTSASNFKSKTGIDLSSLLNFTLTNSNPDTTSPTIISLNKPSQLADGQLNLSSGESPLLTIAGKITDTNDAGSSGSGFSYLSIQFAGPNSQNKSIYINQNDLATDGSFAKDLDMSWALSGNWIISYAYISDKAGNQVNYQYSDPTSASNFKNKTGIDLSSFLNFTLTNPNHDTTPPIIATHSKPSQLLDGRLDIDNGESPILNFNGRIIDSNDTGGIGSGFESLFIGVTASNTGSKWLNISKTDLTSDGSFAKAIDMSWATPGNWHIFNASIRDLAGNEVYQNFNGLNDLVAANNFRNKTGIDLSTLLNFDVVNTKASTAGPDNTPPRVSFTLTSPQLTDGIIDIAKGESAKIQLQGKISDLNDLGLTGSGAYGFRISLKDSVSNKRISLIASKSEDIFGGFSPCKVKASNGYTGKIFLQANGITIGWTDINSASEASSAFIDSNILQFLESSGGFVLTAITANSQSALLSLGSSIYSTNISVKVASINNLTDDGSSYYIIRDNIENLSAALATQGSVANALSADGRILGKISNNGIPVNYSGDILNSLTTVPLPAVINNDGSFSILADLGWAGESSWSVDTAYLQDNAGNQYWFDGSIAHSNEELAFIQSRTGINFGSNALNFKIINSSATTTQDTGDATFTIAGALNSGQALTATTIANDPDGNGATGFSYNWQTSSNGSSWTNVGTNSPSYTIAATDEGKQIRLLVSYIDGKGFNESVTVNAGTIAAIPPEITGISVQGNQLILSFSEAINTTGLTTSRFAVTVGGTSRSIASITPVTGDPTKLLLNLSGTVAPTSSQVVAVSYTDPSPADEPSGVVQDLAGIDMASTLTPRYADTFSSSTTVASLAAPYLNLLLSGTAAINATGNANANTITGNLAANVLNGGAGDDTLVGGLGNDTYVVDSLGDLLVENPTSGTDLVQSSVSWTLAANFENLSLTGTAAIDGTGNALNNVINGNSARNLLSGLDGNDSLNGAAGNDDLFGGNGNDTLTGGLGDDLLDGGAGTDTASYAGSSAAVSVNLSLAGPQLTGGAGIDTLVAIENLTGSSFNDSLSGNSSNNLLNGGAGADVLSGGLGNDTYVVDNIADKVVENPNSGTDLVQSSVSFLLAANVENLSLTGTAAIDGTGNALNNSINGNAARNLLSGLDGNDSLNGGAGNDDLFGGNGNDTLTGGLGDDRLDGGAGTDTASYAGSSAAVSVNLSLAGPQLTGGAGMDTLISIENLTGSAFNDSLSGDSNSNLLSGGAGADSLSGGLGNDILIGGAGADVLSGGADADTFRFASFSESLLASFDTITDFSIGSDAIDASFAVSAANLAKLGSVSALNQAGIAAVLSSSSFLAKGAATFSFGSGPALRQFIALNDALAGFDSTKDAIIEITGFSGDLNSLAIV